MKNPPKKTDRDTVIEPNESLRRPDEEGPGHDDAVFPIEQFYEED